MVQLALVELEVLDDYDELVERHLSADARVARGVAQLESKVLIGGAEHERVADVRELIDLRLPNNRDRRGVKSANVTEYRNRQSASPVS